jgi:hypothetical protein
MLEPAPEFETVAGFPEMWQPVYNKYKGFFDCAVKLQPIVGDMLNRPVEGQLLHTVGRMAAAAANSYCALLTLALNGYGHDAMKIARSVFEIELNILRLKAHPDEIDDFLNFNFIQQKLLYDTFDEEQKQQVTTEEYQRMMDNYNRVLPDFLYDKRNQVPRNEWCKETLYKRAKEAGPDMLYLYRTFYRHASSIHHMDVGGLISTIDSEMHAHMAPSWEHIEDALVASGSVLRIIEYFVEMANLPLKEQLESGPKQEYVKALSRLHK